MTASDLAIEGSQLSKRFGRISCHWALRDCTFRVPVGRVAALVGPNGSGKSTLLRIAAGLLRPTSGSLRVLGEESTAQAIDTMSRIGYLDQQRSLFPSFRVDELLRLGRAMNPRWDEAFAQQYLVEAGIAVSSRVGSLSGGHQAQVALSLCLAKRPELLLLDEPAASLDPLARDQLMHTIMELVADGDTSVVISSHALAELAPVCDYIVILSDSMVQVADDLDSVLANHRLLTGPRRPTWRSPDGMVVVAGTHTERQSHWLVRMDAPASEASWEIVAPTLQEIVLGYLRDRMPTGPELVGAAVGTPARGSSGTSSEGRSDNRTEYIL